MSVIVITEDPQTYLPQVHVHKIHVPSMLTIGVDKHTQQTNKQPQWLH